MWACEWLDNICAWVRKVKVVPHQDTSCWVFNPNTFKPMSHIIYPALNSGQAYFGQTGENPPYKGGWWKIDYHQEGGMNQISPNYGLALRWPHPCSLPIEWGSRGCPECQPSTTGDTGHPGLAVGKRRRWKKLPLAVALC